MSLQDPRYLANEPHHIPLRNVPFAEPGGQLPDWTRERGQPLIYLTLGTVFSDTSVLRTAIDGLGGLDARIIVATGLSIDATTLEAPENTTILPWVSQADLLSQVDLVVHHGGSGTTLGAACAGVPQLFLPQGGDHIINAEAVRAAGAGEAVMAVNLTADAIADRAKFLLHDEEVKARATALAGEIAAMPSPNAVATQLPEIDAA